MPEIHPKYREIPDRFASGYLERLDGRTAIAVEMRARWQSMTDDLGGVDRLSYSQRSLVERALWIEHWIAQQERELAEGRIEAFDAGRWTQATNSLLGLYRTLGIERRAKDVTDLASYIASKAGAS